MDFTTFINFVGMIASTFMWFAMPCMALAGLLYVFTAFAPK